MIHIKPRFYTCKAALCLVLLLGVFAQTWAAAEQNTDYRMSTASNGDVDIAYRVVGDPKAEPILIIMGLSASHRVWNSQLIACL